MIMIINVVLACFLIALIDYADVIAITSQLRYHICFECLILLITSFFKFLVRLNGVPGFRLARWIVFLRILILKISLLHVRKILNL